MWTLLTAALLAATTLTAPVYSRGEGDLEVAIPRIEERDIDIDGRLEEAAWGRAAPPTDFTQVVISLAGEACSASSKGGKVD